MDARYFLFGGFCIRPHFIEGGFLASATGLKPLGIKA